MLTTLFVLVSHPLFDWSCRKSPTTLAQNFGEIVQESFGISPDLSISSPIYKGAKKLYDLTRQKKNSKQSKMRMMKNEEVNLKAFEIKIEGVVVRGDPEILEKRKNFEDLTSRTSKRARVTNVIEMLENDIGLEEKVLEKLETRNGGKSEEEGLDMACLAVMKTLGLSNHKYDDLRFWVQEMARRNFNLSLMPTSRQLMEKVQAEMVPPNMSSNSTGASIPLIDALHHHGGRFMLRLINSPLPLS